MIISTDKSKLNIKLIYNYLSKQSYWAKGRSLDAVTCSIENSMCFGVYTNNNKQIAFARVITDQAVFAYILDVFVLKEYQQCGIGKSLIHHIVNHPKLSKVGKISLATADAHGLYSKFGFKNISNPEMLMERVF